MYRMVEKRFTNPFMHESDEDRPYKTYLDRYYSIYGPVGELVMVTRDESRAKRCTDRLNEALAAKRGV